MSDRTAVSTRTFTPLGVASCGRIRVVVDLAKFINDGLLPQPLHVLLERVSPHLALSCAGQGAGRLSISLSSRSRFVAIGRLVCVTRQLFLNKTLCERHSGHRRQRSISRPPHTRIKSPPLSNLYLLDRARLSEERGKKYYREYYPSRNLKWA